MSVVARKPLSRLRLAVQLNEDTTAIQSPFFFMFTKCAYREIP